MTVFKFYLIRQRLSKLPPQQVTHVPFHVIDPALWTMLMIIDLFSKLVGGGGGDTTRTGKHKKGGGSDDEEGTTGESSTDQYYDDDNEGIPHDEEGNLDQAYFDEFEDLYGFKNGALLEFYQRVREAYAFELMSTKSKDIMIAVDTFIHRFLTHLSPPLVDHGKNGVYIGTSEIKEDTITFPRIISSDSALDVHCIDTETDYCTFLVDSKLDFVYSYIMELAIIDTLTHQAESLLGKRQNNDYNAELSQSRLDALEQSRLRYRRRAEFKYIYCTADGSDHSRLNSRFCSNSKVIYTKRSSEFYRACFARIENQPHITFSHVTLHDESIPFQQVLLLCGHTSAFIAKHCPSTEDACVVTATSDAHDWVSLPIWFYLLAIAELKNVEPHSSVLI